MNMQYTTHSKDYDIVAPEPSALIEALRAFTVHLDVFVHSSNLFVCFQPPIRGGTLLSPPLSSLTIYAILPLRQHRSLASLPLTITVVRVLSSSSNSP